MDATLLWEGVVQWAVWADGQKEPTIRAARHRVFLKDTGEFDLHIGFRQAAGGGLAWHQTGDLGECDDENVFKAALRGIAQEIAERRETVAVTVEQPRIEDGNREKLEAAEKRIAILNLDLGNLSAENKQLHERNEALFADGKTLAQRMLEENAENDRLRSWIGALELDLQRLKTTPNPKRSTESSEKPHRIPNANSGPIPAIPRRMSGSVEETVVGKQWSAVLDIDGKRRYYYGKTEQEVRDKMAIAQGTKPKDEPAVLSEKQHPYRTRHREHFIEVLRTYGPTDSKILGDKLGVGKDAIRNLARALMSEGKIEEGPSRDARKTVYQLAGDHESRIDAPAPSKEESEPYVPKEPVDVGPPVITAKPAASNGAPRVMPKIEYETTDADAEPTSDALAQFQIDRKLTPKVRFTFLKELVDDQYPQEIADLAIYLSMTKDETAAIATAMTVEGWVELDPLTKKLSPSDQGRTIVLNLLKLHEPSNKREDAVDG